MKTTKNIILISVAAMAFIIFTFHIFLSLYLQQSDALSLNQSILENNVIKEANLINYEIDQISQNARVLALLIGRSENHKIQLYDSFIKDTIQKVDIVFGMGYWFEPYEFDEKRKYYGPYIYKNENNAIVRTMEYSNEEYDYFSHDWYKNSILSKSVTAFSKPFYDEYLDTVFLTAAVKILNEEKQIGVVSIDITLREINTYLNEMSEKNNSSAFIITQDGYFWGDSEGFGLDLEDNILDSENKEMRLLGNKILNNQLSGSLVLDNNIFVWSNIGDTGLSLINGYSKSSIMDLIYANILFSVILFIVTMLVFIFLLNITLVKLIEKPLINIINRNITSIDEEDINIRRIGTMDPNFDNMIHLIENLLTERQKYIHKLDNNNKELNEKNLEIEALYNQTEAMNKELIELLEEILRGYIVTVRSLSNAIEAKDEYTKGHCENVTEYSLATAKILGIEGEELKLLEYASLLHDVGKIGIPSTILNKPSRLSSQEYEIIKSHPTIGYEILKDIEFLKRSSEIVYEHHERYDGEGYPRGLKDEEIDILTKILTVADAYDAMTSARPYRQNPLSHNEAIEILKKEAGKQFDPEVVKAFIIYMTN